MESTTSRAEFGSHHLSDDEYSILTVEPPNKRSRSSFYSGVKMMPRKPASNFSCREGEQKKLKLALQSEDCATHSIKVAITGPPGVGKTELAINVVSDCYDQFDHIIWINCTSPETIKRDLTLAISLLDLPSTILGVESQVLMHRIYHHCSTFKSLFIFDNVTDRDELLNLLPNYINYTNSIFILVTSFYRDWESEYSINLKPFDTENTKIFLKKLLPELTNLETSKLSCFLAGIPFIIQLAISYIKNQRELKSIEGTGGFSSEDFTRDLVKGVKKLRQYKMNDCEKLGYTKTLETLYENLVTSLKNEPNGEIAFKLYIRINLIKCDDIPISLFKLKNDNDLSINEAFLLLEKYCIVSSIDRKFYRSYFLPYIALHNFSNILEKHRTELYHLFLDKCVESTALYNTLMFESSIYLPHAKKFFQVLATTTCDGLKLGSKIPFIIVNSEFMDFRETILFIDAYYKKLETILGWENIDYIGIQTILIKCHFKLKHHQKVLELCESAEKNLPEQFIDSVFNLHILHFRASSLHKEGRLKEAYLLAKRVYEKRLIMYGSINPDYLATLRRMCAIVTKLYENGDTISVTLFKDLCNRCLSNDENHLTEKIQFVAELEKYFNRMGRLDDLLPIFDNFHDFLIQIKGPDSMITMLLLVMKSSYLCSIGNISDAWSLCSYLVQKLGLIQMFVEQPNQVVMMDFIESLEVQVNERL